MSQPAGVLKQSALLIEMIGHYAIFRKNGIVPFRLWITFAQISSCIVHSHCFITFMV